MEKKEETQDYHCHESGYVDESGQLQVTKVPVLQELVRRGLTEVPPRFKLASSSDHQPVTTLAQVPFTISLAKLRDKSSLQESRDELERLSLGAKNWGMFFITDHGIDSLVLEKVKEVVKGFFDLPFELKKVSVGTNKSIDNMGYGRNFVKKDKPLDWIDRITIIAAPTDVIDDRVWPYRPQNFREVMEMYVGEARKVLNELLEYLAQAFNLDKKAFIRFFDPTRSVINLRINYYPPCPAPESVLGITPHSDASCLTLLTEHSEASVGSLQVMNKDKEWQTIFWPQDEKDALLVSAGDLLEIMSNGTIQSPWHRVVTHKNAERFSVALFYNPPENAEIDPAATVGEADVGAKYRKIVVGDYLRHLYAISPTDDKQGIMLAKLD